MNDLERTIKGIQSKLLSTGSRNDFDSLLTIGNLTEQLFQLSMMYYGYKVESVPVDCQKGKEGFPYYPFDFWLTGRLGEKHAIDVKSCLASRFEDTVFVETLQRVGGKMSPIFCTESFTDAQYWQVYLDRVNPDVWHFFTAQRLRAYAFRRNIIAGGNGGHGFKLKIEKASFQLKVIQ